MRTTIARPARLGDGRSSDRVMLGHIPAVAVWSYAEAMDRSRRRSGTRSPLAARVALVCALLGVLMLSGCAPEGGLPVEGRGLDVELRQNRDQYAAHTAIIRISNTSQDPVVVTSLEVSGSAFTEATTRERTSAVPAGQTKDLAIVLPRADCDATADRLQAGVVLHLDDGSTVSIDALPDPTNALPRIHATDCTATRVAALATVSAAPTVRLKGSGPTTVAVLTISVIPTGGPGRLELVELRSTVLLQPAPSAPGGTTAEAWPLHVVVDASSSPLTIDIRIVPTRCDPHALAEDKVGTLFPLVVRIDGGEESVLTLPLQAGTAEALKTAVRVRCA